MLAGAAAVAHLALLPAAAQETLSPEPLGPPTPETPITPTPAPGEAEAPAELGPDQVELSAGRLFTNERTGAVEAEGGITARWQDVLITGESALLDRRADTLAVEGPLRAVREDGTWIETERFDLDLDKYWYTTGPFQAQIAAEEIGYGVVEPINLLGRELFGIRDTYFSALGALLTSCPPEDLKWHVRADEIIVVPNRKITLDSGTAYLFGVPIFWLPKITLPLRRFRRTEWLPEFGRNEVYGFYGRYRYFYDLAPSQLGNVSGMVTEKRGQFLGFEHDFGYGRGTFRGEGSADFEYGTKNSEFSFRGDLRQGLGSDADLRMNTSYSQNSGFSSTSSRLNLTGVLTQRYTLGSTALSFNRSQTETGASSSAFSDMSLEQRFDLGLPFTANLRADYSVRDNPGQETDLELNTNLRMNGRWTLFDWEVLDQRRFDLEGSRFASDDQRPVTEIIPQLTLRSDNERLGLRLGEWVDLDIDSSIGQFREFITPVGGGDAVRENVLRLNYDVDGTVGRFALGENARFITTLRYNQSFYGGSQPSAKYILAFAPTLEVKPWRYGRLDIGYRWQEVAGFAPLPRFDFAQTLNDIDYTLNLFVPDPVRPLTGLVSASISGGFDLLRGRPRDMRLQLQAQPIDPLYLRFNTSYDLGGGFGQPGLRSIRGEINYDGGRRYRHSVGFTYDPQNGKLTNLDSLIEAEILPRVTVNHALTYDGFREKVTFNDILATYDMGCVQLIGVYRQETREYRLDINITAFPGFTSLFGTGRFGQQFSTSQGVGF